MARKRTVSARQAGRPRRVPVEKLLPDSVALQLRRRVDATGDVTSKIVAELDKRFEIERRYGVSKRRLSNYLKRVCAKAAVATSRDSAASDGTSPTPTPSSSEPSGGSSEPQPESLDERISAHRRRQVPVGAILNDTFGRFAETNPDLWDRRAYLMLVGLVYVRLVTNEEEFSTEELVTLSKILAESRRAEAQSRKALPPGDGSQETSSPTHELPENFADIVRQVYGTNFQMPARAVTALTE